MRSVALALIALVAVIIGISAAGAAFGQQAPCAPLDTIRKVLAEHSEVAVWAGFDAARNAVLQLWQSPGGSWTLIIVGANGTGCLVAEGTSSGVRNAL